MGESWFVFEGMSFGKGFRAEEPRMRDLVFRSWNELDFMMSIIAVNASKIFEGG